MAIQPIKIKVKKTWNLRLEKYVLGSVDFWKLQGTVEKLDLPDLDILGLNVHEIRSE